MALDKNVPLAANQIAVDLAAINANWELVVPLSGDLGTPSAGDLANCTGLPTAGLINDAVTYAKMQNVSATDKLLGRSTAGAGDVEEIACTAAGRAILDDANAAAQRATLGAAASGANTDITSLGALSGAQTIPTINLTGGQIAFPATAVPSADPNTLDDYEEGEYTGTLTCGTSGTITLAAAQDTLAHTKTGRKVTVTGTLLAASVSSPVGSLRVNLPFAMAVLTDTAEEFTSAVLYQGINTLGTAAPLLLLGVGGNVYIVETTTTGVVNDVAVHIAANTYLTFGFTYFST